jgi:RNA ligase (TIGR02306 family)
VNSTHKVEVVPVVLESHPNADSLSIVRVFGYSVCVRTADWIGVSIGAYLPPDSVVDTSRREFAFLAKAGKDRHRMRAMKLRGVVSFGLLIHAPVGAVLGDDVAEVLGVTHYEPPMGNTTGGQTESPPPVPAPTYDLDTARRYAECFTPGEPVYVTEKIHGTSARYVFHDGRMYAGSRKEWKTPDDSIVYWAALKNHPEVEEFCRKYPGTVVYGEIYGWVQELRYGHQPGCVSFATFDIFHEGQWMGHSAARSLGPELPWVPQIAGPIPFDFDRVCEFAEGQTTVPGADHVREGVVIVPESERYDERIGRVKLKLVGASYLES